MKFRSFLLLAFLSFSAAAFPRGLQARVDRRVELVSTVFFLAGVEEFSQCRSAAYLTAVEAYFAPFREHPAVQEARRLAQERHVHFVAPVSLALHLDDSLRLRPGVQPGPNYFFAPRPEGPPVPPGGSLDFRWTVPLARSFADLLRDFARDSRFDAFFTRQRSFFATAEARLSALAAKLDLAWIGRTARHPALILLTSPLLGPNNYGPSLPGGRSAAVIGIWHFDEAGRPRYDPSAWETLVHESFHPVVNPAVDTFMSLLKPPAEALAKARAKDFERTGYSGESFNTDFLYESLVRGLEVLYARDHEGQPAADALRRKYVGKGWTWLPDLLPWLDRARAGGALARRDADAFRELAALLNSLAAGSAVARNPSPPRLLDGADRVRP